MDIATNLVAGIASSLLAIGITETYHWVRLRRGKRNLGEALGFYNAPCSVVTPSFSVEIAGTKARFGETSDRVRVIREPDVYAIGTAVAVCREASSLPTVMPAKPGLQNPPPNLICVGSWSGNDVSAIMLENHCPGFRIVNREKEQSDFDSIYYECGDQIFRDTPQETHAFIMKMSPAYTGLTGSVIILWGHHRSGNQAAAE